MPLYYNNNDDDQFIDIISNDNDNSKININYEDRIKAADIIPYS